MLSRAFAALIAIVALLGLTDHASAQSDNERYEMLGGGSPRGRNYNFFGFGGSDTTRTRVSYGGSHKPGTIVINTAERRLYLVQGDGTAIRYGIGVGRVGFTWSGVPRSPRRRNGRLDAAAADAQAPARPAAPHGGRHENPLGARAIYLGSTLYRIHGSNEPETIGQAVSSGCFRMTNEDVMDLYDRVQVGTTVIVQ